MATIYSAITSNKRKTWLIMILFVMFFVTVGYIIGKALGYDSWAFIGTLLLISSLTSLTSYFFSDKMILSLSGAKRATEKEHKQLLNTVENLCIAAGAPKPSAYVIQDPAPNAFATGRDPQHATIAVTTGLLQKLRNAELEGVIAHELSHVKNYDTRLMTVVAILVGSLALLSNFFLKNLAWSGRSRDRRGNQLFLLLAIIFSVLAPLIATIIQFAISRRREYLADADGALLTRYPEGLAQALEKIAADQTNLTRANLAMAHLYFENPFQHEEKKNWLLHLFSTHPPIEERIKILRSM